MRRRSLSLPEISLLPGATANSATDPLEVVARSTTDAVTFESAFGLSTLTEAGAGFGCVAHARMSMAGGFAEPECR